jgi:hypothetical protein
LIGDDGDLRALLSTLDPKVRDDLRRVPIHDQADRDVIASHLMRYRNKNGQDWAKHHRLADDAPGEWRKVARVLGEIEAADHVRRTGQAGERRGTRPSFALGALRPALGSRLRRRSLPTFYGEVRANSGEGYWWLECSPCDIAWQVPHYAESAGSPVTSHSAVNRRGLVAAKKISKASVEPAVPSS